LLSVLKFDVAVALLITNDHDSHLFTVGQIEPMNKIRLMLVKLFFTDRINHLKIANNRTDAPCGPCPTLFLYSQLSGKFKRSKKSPLGFKFVNLLII